MFSMRTAAVFMLLLIALPARADDFAAGLILGYEVLTHDAGRVSDDGICYGVFADYFIDPELAVEGTLLYSQHDDVVDDEGSHKVNVLSFLLGPKFMFPMKKTVPWVSFGPSLHSVDYTFDPESGSGVPRDESDTEAGLFASLGLRLPLTQRLAMGFSLSYHYLFNTDVLDGDTINSSISLEF